ncbi:hypothetical protein OVX87_32055 [Klebsiella pneumoniae]|nr:hypothetical protein [Klebsiella pneumoniae]MCY0629528.1 hypothetical protein [Klebsiella pneumoniae]
MTQKGVDDVAWLDVSGDDTPPSPVQVNAECCSRCRWPARRLFRLREAENDAVCAVCWISHNLDTASAHQGDLCWLPGLHAADVVNLQRIACIATIAGNSHAKNRGSGYFYGCAATNGKPNAPGIRPARLNLRQ